MSFIDFVMFECIFPDISPLYCPFLPLPPFTLLQSNSLILPKFHKREKNLNIYVFIRLTYSIQQNLEHFINPLFILLQRP